MPLSFPVGINPEGIATDDFDRDGKLDIAVANLASGDVTVYLGVGNGHYGWEQQYLGY